MMKSRNIYMVLFIIVLAFIWGQSFLSEDLSAKESIWFTTNIINPVLKFFGLKGLANETVRKIAHATEFALLGFTCYGFLKRDLKSTVHVLLICFAAAFLDETIQIFTTRGSSVTDVWIDILGAAIGCALGFLILRRKGKKS